MSAKEDAKLAAVWNRALDEKEPEAHARLWEDVVDTVLALAHSRKALKARARKHAADPVRRAIGTAFGDFLTGMQEPTGNRAAQAVSRIAELSRVTFTDNGESLRAMTAEDFRQMAERVTQQSMTRGPSEHGISGILRSDGGRRDKGPLKSYPVPVRAAVRRALADAMDAEVLTSGMLPAAVARAIPGVTQAKADQIADAETDWALSVDRKRARDLEKGIDDVMRRAVSDALIPLLSQSNLTLAQVREAAARAIMG